MVKRHLLRLAISWGKGGFGGVMNEDQLHDLLASQLANSPTPRVMCVKMTAHTLTKGRTKEPTKVAT